MQKSFHKMPIMTKNLKYPKLYIHVVGEGLGYLRRSNNDVLS